MILEPNRRKISVLDAYCVHMAPIWVMGGTVEGKYPLSISWFCFDTKGDCTKTGYSTKAPKARYITISN
ncbi:MAG: hypothetical protein IPP53_15275 [Bacteroidetes bacterium]|nr:hypothetical protein [Bacteroidota bacterium]